MKNDEPTKTTTLTIEGMSCDGCRASVMNALKRVAGVREVEVDLAHARGVVRHDRNTATEDLLRAINDAGFKGAISGD